VEDLRLSQVSGTRQLALAEQRQHLGSSDLRHAMHEVILAHGLLGLR
jgi:hypothetical protein